MDIPSDRTPRTRTKAELLHAEGGVVEFLRDLCENNSAGAKRLQTRTKEDVNHKESLESTADIARQILEFLPSGCDPVISGVIKHVLHHQIFCSVAASMELPTRRLAMDRNEAKAMAIAQYLLQLSEWQLSNANNAARKIEDLATMAAGNINGLGI